MKTRIQHLSLIAALAAVFGSCRGCEERGPAAILELPAAGTQGVVVVPNLGELAKGLEAFVTRATRKAGAEAIRRMRLSLTQQYGFDPLDPSTYSKLGLTPNGGCLVFTEGDSKEPLLAFAITDRDLFDAAVKEMIKKTDGASRYSEEKRFGTTVITAGRPFGTEVVPAFHWAHIGSFALAVREEGREGLEAALARLESKRPGDKKDTLATDPLYLSLSRKIPSGQLSVFARGAAATELFQSNSAALSGGVITGVKMGADGFSLDSFFDLLIPGLDKALAAPPVLSLANEIEKDAAVVMLTGIAGPDGVAAIRAHPAMSKLLDQAISPLGNAIGVDAEKEVLPLLAGPLTLGVHVVELAGLPKRLKERRSLNALLDFFHVAVIAKVKDPGKFLALLERSKEGLEKSGVKLRRRELTVGKEKAILFEPDRPNPKLGWALVGDHYVYGAGAGRVERVLSSMRKGSTGLADDLSTSVAGELASQRNSSLLLVRVGVLADAAAQISMGTGQTKLGVGALIGTALELLRTVGDVAAAVSAEPGGIRLRVRERLR